MILKDIADTIDMDVSTVSRVAIANMWIHLMAPINQGVFSESMKMIKAKMFPRGNQENTGNNHCGRRQENRIRMISWRKS